MNDDEPLLTGWEYLEPGDYPELARGWYRFVVVTDRPAAFVEAPREPPYPDDFIARLAAEDARLRREGWFHPSLAWVLAA